jgi:hypothetical protein
MKDKTPDQIRRATVPNKHHGLIYGFLGAFLGTVIWFGGWGLLHEPQVRRYPEYCAHAFKSSVGDFSLFAKPKLKTGMSAEELRYELLRFGNQDHHLDAEILRHGWYPRGASPKAWVYVFGNVKPVYSDSAAMVFKWPLTLTLLTTLGCAIWGLVADYKYRSSVIAGVPFDGSVVATVDDYNREVHGDGMAYTIKPWKDR